MRTFERTPPRRDRPRRGTGRRPDQRSSSLDKDPANECAHYPKIANMKQKWSPGELIELRELTPTDLEIVSNTSIRWRLAFALQLLVVVV